ncbi:hypothetical protein AB0K02_24445 [Streptomyces sp. NPDC049597]|uniref:hypothetical protein n=1 Tax=Streptomyces sp. NPDC049597 TaxID=3155276 RepID=UPI0034179C61
MASFEVAEEEVLRWGAAFIGGGAGLDADCTRRPGKPLPRSAQARGCLLAG